MDHSSYFPLQDENEENQSAIKHMEENALDNEDLFAWITQHGKGCNLYVVPVIHFGEQHTYRNYTGSVGAKWWPLGMLQSWCWQRFQYEFPLVLSGWMGSIVPQRGYNIPATAWEKVAKNSRKVERGFFA